MTRNDWIKKMMDEGKENISYEYCGEFIVAMNIVTREVGVAKCGIENDSEMSFAVALARLNKEEIPEYILEEVKNY